MFRHIPIYLGMGVTFALAPVWYRFPGAPQPFTADYVTGFAVFIPIIGTIIGWIVLGLPGFRASRRDRKRGIWILLLLSLVLWMWLSTSWAFVGDQRPEVAVGTALQFSLAALFVVGVVCTAPPRGVVIGLVIGLVVHGVLGGLQVAEQGSLGLWRLGEFDLNPQRSGVSVIQSGNVRWLRPYGLSSHSNIYAGFICVGVLATAGLILSSNRVLRWCGTFAFWFGLWILMLTFSRAAWLGFAVGAFGLFVILIGYGYFKSVFFTTHPSPFIERFLIGAGLRLAPPHTGKQDNISIIRHMVLTLAGAVVLVIAFFILYRPLLLARAGVGQSEYTETRSLEDRAIFNRIAMDAIRNHPTFGVGIGNYPWYASWYLFAKTNTGMRGDNVHNVYLFAFAELGVIGLGLVIALLVLGMWTALGGAGDLIGRPYSSHQIDCYALLAGAVALTVIGFFDHYTWTLIHFQVLWWGLLAVAMRSHLNEKIN